MLAFSDKERCAEKGRRSERQLNANRAGDRGNNHSRRRQQQAADGAGHAATEARDDAGARQIVTVGH